MPEPGTPLRPQDPCWPCPAAVPAAFPSCAQPGAMPGAVAGKQPLLLHGSGGAPGLGMDPTHHGGRQVSVFPSRRGQWDAWVPRGAQPAGSPTGFMQERDRRDEPEQQFPERLFGLAAQSPVPHSPDAQLRGGIAGCLKPGLAAGPVSGWGQSSSQELASAPTLHSCPAAARLSFPSDSPTQALGLLSKPSWGNNSTFSLTSLVSPVLGWTHPIPSAGPAQLPTNLLCSQRREQLLRRSSGSAGAAQPGSRRSQLG